MRLCTAVYMAPRFCFRRPAPIPQSVCPSYSSPHPFLHPVFAPWHWVVKEARQVFRPRPHDNGGENNILLHRVERLQGVVRWHPGVVAGAMGRRWRSGWKIVFFDRRHRGKCEGWCESPRLEVALSTLLHYIPLAVAFLTAIVRAVSLYTSSSVFQLSNGPVGLRCLLFAP